jgi:hypothetical protein
MLVAHVPPTSVNIAHTILCRMNFATGSAEQEVRLLKGADINLLAVHQGKLHNSTYVRDLGVMIPKKRYENKIFEA